jgi:hypothetical protein
MRKSAQEWSPSRLQCAEPSQMGAERGRRTMDEGKNVIDLFRIRSLADHPPLHQKVLLKAAELAEEAVRLGSPFDRLKHTKLWSRTRYPALEKLGPGEKDLILEAMTATAMGRAGVSAVDADGW